MKILLTGPFGNVGRSTLEESLNRGHEVTCFDVPTDESKKLSEAYEDRIRLLWGDLRNFDEVSAAVKGQEAIIHVAFIIPSTTAHTGISSEDQPQYSYEVNVGGTQNLITAAKAAAQPPKFIFCSTQNLFGRTQDQPPPRTIADPVVATSHYTAHKIECEKMLMASGLEWVILRLCGVLPIRLDFGSSIFDVPLNNRIEFVHTRDVGLACVNALSCKEAVGKILLIGGGPRCQARYRDFIARSMDLFGLGMLPEESFSKIDSCHDWVDTTESQRLLSFQRRTLDDYIEDLRTLIAGLSARQ